MKFAFLNWLMLLNMVKIATISRNGEVNKQASKYCGRLLSFHAIISIAGKLKLSNYNY